MRYFIPFDPYVEDGSKAVYRLSDDLVGEFEVIGEITELGFFVPENDPMQRVVGSVSNSVWLNNYEEVTGKNVLKEFIIVK